MTEKTRQFVPPFHQRFNIEFGAEEAQKSFMNKVANMIPVYIELAKEEEPDVLWHLANRLGEYFTGREDYKNFLGKDFHSYLRALEKTYEIFWGDDDFDFRERSRFRDTVEGWSILAKRSKVIGCSFSQ